MIFKIFNYDDYEVFHTTSGKANWDPDKDFCSGYNIVYSSSYIFNVYDYNKYRTISVPYVLSYKELSHTSVLLYRPCSRAVRLEYNNGNLLN